MSGAGWHTFRAKPRQSDDWIVWLTDDELELLMQVAEPAIAKPMGRDQLTATEPLPVWAPVVVRRLRTQARWRRRGSLRQQRAESATAAPSSSVSADPLTGFKAWLHAIWPSAPVGVRRSLAATARAFGVSVPRERRSRAGNARAGADARTPPSAADMRSPTERTALRSRIGAKVSAAVRSVVQSVVQPAELKPRDIPAELSVPAERESDWTRSDSLHDALRGDGRDWH